MTAVVEDKSAYSVLKEKAEKVDLLLKEGVAKFKSRSSKRAYKEYLSYPSVPEETDLTAVEIHRWSVYFDDMKVLLDDIQDAREFEILCMVFQEVKMDLYVARKGNDRKRVIAE